LLAGVESPHFPKCAAGGAPAGKKAISETDFENVGIGGAASGMVAEFFTGLAPDSASRWKTGLEFIFAALRLGLELALQFGAVLALDLELMLVPGVASIVVSSSAPIWESEFGFVTAAAD
jgi:hypothetical protein